MSLTSAIVYVCVYKALLQSACLCYGISAVYATAQLAQLIVRAFNASQAVVTVSASLAT
jgi:hypothetical protein